MHKVVAVGLMDKQQHRQVAAHTVAVAVKAAGAVLVLFA
jgi:hypothetical protein